MHQNVFFVFQVKKKEEKEGGRCSYFSCRKWQNHVTQQVDLFIQSLYVVAEYNIFFSFYKLTLKLSFWNLYLKGRNEKRTEAMQMKSCARKWMQRKLENGMHNLLKCYSISHSVKIK